MCNALERDGWMWWFYNNVSFKCDKGVFFMCVNAFGSSK